ncbi:MAG: glycosyl hydrolase-related protein, partial [Clostridiales bacterium]|nr:glycosyl hydrolase-related protein [Clostridiales bacterium]
DKKTGLEFIKGHGAVPVSIDESDCDTWAHGKARFSGETQEFTLKTIKAIEEGPLRAGIRMTSTLNTSILVQDFLLRHDSPEIEVRVRLDLREKHRAIKLGFGVNVEDPVATYEIPYGYISRPTDGRENPGQQWIDVSGTGENGEIKGLTLLNDAKFSYDVLGSTMRMTIARSPMYADHFGIRDDFPYFLDQGIQEFKYALIPHSGDWREANPSRKAQELNEPSVQVAGSPHKGTLPQTLEFIRIDARNVIATALKRSEDNDGFILRCYETDGADTQVRIELPLLGRAWDARFGSCEIKTFWIPEDAAGAVEERNLVEMKL